jgi:hypothetical protein
VGGGVVMAGKKFTGYDKIEFLKGFSSGWNEPEQSH